MKVDDVYLDATLFLAYEERGDDGVVSRVPRATGFIVGIEGKEVVFPYVVTARHCIQEAAGGPIYVRVNSNQGFDDFRTSQDDWFLHDSADVALMPMLIPEPSLGVSYNLGAIPPKLFVGADYRYRPPAQISVYSGIEKGKPTPEVDIPVHVGGEVYFVGLFVQHAGRERNLPVARFGHISRMPIESLTVERTDGSREEILGYLAECRSWGGHSGSPVFWASQAVGLVKVPDHEALIQQPTHAIALLGLVSAHYDINQKARTEGDILGSIRTAINSGIAVVTPAAAIGELLEREDVMEDREKRKAAGEGQDAAATYDVGQGSEASEFQRLRS